MGGRSSPSHPLLFFPLFLDPPGMIQIQGLPPFAALAGWQAFNPCVDGRSAWEQKVVTGGSGPRTLSLQGTAHPPPHHPSPPATRCRKTVPVKLSASSTYCGNNQHSMQTHSLEAAWNSAALGLLPFLSSLVIHSLWWGRGTGRSKDTQDPSVQLCGSFVVAGWGLSLLFP